MNKVNKKKAREIADKKLEPAKMKKIIAKLIKTMGDPDFVGVFDDLVAYTGLSARAVSRHIIASSKKIRAELKFVSPDGFEEMELFYRCCREYLFLNARRYVSKQLTNAHDAGLLRGPVLDFGAGMGNDSVWLARHGYDVTYHDISAVQREFMRFRVDRRKLNIEIAWPYVDGCYDSLKCIRRMYGVVFTRDVLEHVADYRYIEIVNYLVDHLRPDGVFVEHTPWNERARGEWVKFDPLHHEEGHPLGKVFEELGLKEIRLGIWRRKKSG